MYVPEHFKETNGDDIARLIGNYPLALIVCHAHDDMIANHIPLIMDQDGNFFGHIAKANQLHHIIENGSKTLAVFTGQDAYISPNWYPTKAQTHRHVPTWNYQTVHVHGRISFSHEQKEKIAVVGKLTNLHERKLFGKEAWKMSDAPRDYMDGMIDNIVAFTIQTDKIIAKSKVSQNREKQDFDSVANQMEQAGKGDLLNAMTTFKNKGNR